MRIDMTMFYYLFLLCLINNFLSTSSELHPPCSALHDKFNKFNLPSFNTRPTTTHLRLCSSSISNQCCPEIYQIHLRNSTAIELEQLFELSTINLYETIIRLNNDLNQTYVNLIEISRNETHLVLQRGYNKLYHSYRLSIDTFFNNLRMLTSRNYQYDLKGFLEQLFRNILHISLTLNNNQTVLPTYFSCLWKNQPFANNPDLLENQLAVHLGKIFQLFDLLQASQNLVQILSTSVITDQHCIDSYTQLSYCNLCGGRRELPCLANCLNVMENCLVNTTYIDHVWKNSLDALDNLDYFDNIEKVLSSIGLSISDAVMTFFNSGGVQKKDIIDQCGHLRIRRQTFSINQKFDEEYSRSLSLSLLDRQLIHLSRSLQIYRTFWINLPEQICKSTGISAKDRTPCWTGTFISQDGRSSIPVREEQLFNLKFQWILKEMQQKSQIIGNLRRTTSAPNINPTTHASPINQSKIDPLLHNFTDSLKSADLDDYPNDNEFDYSDYAYEDSTDESSTTTTTTSTTTPTTTTTTHRSTTTPIDDEISIDETNTVYYDYGDHDLYSDDEEEEAGKSSTTEEPLVILTTKRMLTTTTTTRSNWKDRIPYYHRRPPIIWNVNKDDRNLAKQEQRRNSGSSSSSHYPLLLFFPIFITRV